MELRELKPAPTYYLLRTATQLIDATATAAAADQLSLWLSVCVLRNRSSEAPTAHPPTELSSG